MDLEKVIELSIPLSIDTDAGWHHARDAWRCERFLYWQQVDPIFEEMSVQDYLVTTTANFIHQAYKEFLRRVLVAHEVRLKDTRIRLAGEADFIVELDGEYVIIELKTCNDFSFSSHKNRAGEYWHEGYNRKPADHHITQLQCYLNMANIRLGILEYFNRNDGRRCSYLFKRDKELYKRIRKKLTAVNTAVEKHLLPPRDLTLNAVFDNKNNFVEGDWQCNPKYCQYSRRCWLECE